MPRQELEVRAPYRKNASEEEFLAQLNQILRSHDPHWELPGTRPYPTVHVIGPPRSGTTFLNQLICHHVDIGYINHLIASFWQAPVQGILLSRKLLNGPTRSDFRSQFGRTSSIDEPHEFGYFWSERLGYPDMNQRDASHAATVDWRAIAEELDRMTRAFERPILFKPFVLNWHLAEFQQAARSSCFIRIRRDAVDNAMSLLQARTEFLGCANRWLSLRPLACQQESMDEQPAWYQVAAQVYHLNRWLDAQTSRLARGSVLELSYEDVCHDPIGTVEQVRAFMRTRGVNLVLRQPVSAACARPGKSHVRHPDVERIADQLARWELDPPVHLRPEVAA